MTQVIPRVFQELGNLKTGMPIRKKPIPRNTIGIEEVVLQIRQIAAFQKHLKGAAPDHLAPVYLILIGDDEERKALMQKTAALFTHYRPKMEVISLQKEKHQPNEVLKALEEDLLFSREKLVIYDGAEGLKKEELERIQKLLHVQKESATLILGASKASSLLVKVLEEEGVILDLSKEKPWDRKKRISDHIFFYLRSKGKQMTPVDLEYFMERLGFNQMLLERECDKLSCYVGDRKEINRQDIDVIATKSEEYSSWKIAKDLIWQEKNLESMQVTFDDLSGFLKMMGALRYQIYIGLLLHQKMRENKPVSLEHVSPKQIGYYGKKCQNLSEYYFIKVLKSLYQLEKKAKESYIKTPELWELTNIYIAAAL